MRFSLFLLLFLSAFLSLVHGYEVLEQFPPERFCRADEISEKKIKCDADWKMENQLSSSFAECDVNAKVKRLKDGKDFTIMFNGSGQKVVPSKQSFNSLINMSNQDYVQKEALKDAKNQTLAKLNSYKTCGSDSFKEELPCDGSEICGSPNPGANVLWVYDMFNSGSVPKNLKTGHYVGRCYLRPGLDAGLVSLNLPGPAYLAFDAEALKYTIFIVPKPDVPTMDYFDKGDRFYTYVDQWVKNFYGVQKSVERYNSLMEDNVIVSSTLNTTIYLRQSSNLLSAVLEAHDVYPGTSGQLFFSRGLFLYCYFFKKVEPIKAP